MRSYKVYLNIYDFMSYNSCLEALAVGAYHTGVEIEYLMSHPAMLNTATASYPPIQTTQESSKSILRVQSTGSTANCT